MDYAEALSQIERLENGSLLVNAIKSRVDGILDEKRRAVSASNSERDRASTLESSFIELAKLLNAEGENVETKAKSILTKITGITTESINNQKTITNLEAAKNAAETKAQEVEEKLKRADRSNQITEAAIAAAANPTVLKKLVSDSDIQLEITQAEDKTTQVLVVQGESKLPLNEFASTNWADFVPSLFPSSTPPVKPPTTLPSGSPNGKGEKRNPVNDYVVGAGFGLKKAAG